MCFIQKLLSRKFIIQCFEKGRSPDLRLNVRLPRIISSDMKCYIKLYSLQLREQSKNEE